MLKILIDATPVQSKPSGVGFYVANLICSLHALQNQGNFQLGIVYQPGMKNWLRGKFSLPEQLERYSPLYLLPLPLKISNSLFLNFPTLFQFWSDRYFDEPHINHGTNYLVFPLSSSKNIMSIYDLTFMKYPQYIDSVVKAYKKRVQQCLKWTDMVLTISESSKKDIVEYLDVNPDQVHVSNLASRYYEGYLSEETAEKLEKYIKYNFDKPYLLFVGTIEPRKNIISLIEAFNFLKHKYKIDHDLVLIGRKGWNYKPIFTAIASSPWKNHIHHLDYLSDDLVALFYSKADAFVYPSYYEGFGLPVLEAMTLGAPVITSNTSSLPEVAGDAALLVDPNSLTSLADAILKVISDSHLRCELIQKGKVRAKLFSWERTAKETLKAYKLISHEQLGST